MNGCVEENRVQIVRGRTPVERSEARIGRGQALASNPWGDRVPRNGSRRKGPQRLFPFLPSEPPYLWVWPHPRVMMKGVNGQWDKDTCRQVGDQEKTFCIHEVGLWFLGRQETCRPTKPGAINHVFKQYDSGTRSWNGLGKVPEHRWGAENYNSGKRRKKALGGSQFVATQVTTHIHQMPSISLWRT